MTEVEKLFDRFRALAALAEIGPDRKTFTGPHDYIANVFKKMSMEDQGHFCELVSNWFQTEDGDERPRTEVA